MQWKRRHRIDRIHLALFNFLTHRGGWDRRGAGEQPSFRFRVSPILAAGEFEFFVEDDVGGFLSLADLSACFGPLAIGSPDAGAETASLGCRPQGHDVDAAIGLLGSDVGGAGDHAAAPMPGELKVASALFDGGDDLVGDVLMNVEPIFRHGLAPVLGGRVIATSWGGSGRTG